MDDVSVDAHDAETGGNSDRLVGHHPDAAREAVHLHREGRRRVQRAVTAIFQSAGDLTRRFIENLAAAMEFLIGHTARRRSDVLAIHLDDQRDIAAGAGQRLLDMRDLRRQFWIIHRGERHIVGSGSQADRPEPVGVDDFGSRRSIDSIGDHFPYGRVLGKTAGQLRRHPRYSRLYSDDRRDEPKRGRSPPAVLRNPLRGNASRCTSCPVKPTFMKKSARVRPVWIMTVVSIRMKSCEFAWRSCAQLCRSRLPRRRMPTRTPMQDSCAGSPTPESPTTARLTPCRPVGGCAN